MLLLLKLPSVTSYMPRFLLLKDWIDETEKVDQGAPQISNLCLLLTSSGWGVGEGEDRAMRTGILTHHWSKCFLARGLEEVRNKGLQRLRHCTDRLLSRRVCEGIIAVIMQENPGEGLGNHFSQRSLSSEIEGVTPFVQWDYGSHTKSWSGSLWKCPLEHTLSPVGFIVLEPNFP